MGEMYLQKTRQPQIQRKDWVSALLPPDSTLSPRTKKKKEKRRMSPECPRQYIEVNFGAEDVKKRSTSSNQESRA